MSAPRPGQHAPQAADRPAPADPRPQATPATDRPEGGAPLHAISPHLDDAVLSVGELLASHPGSTVTTVFTGPAPSPFHTSFTDWDRASGMEAGRDPVAVRRAEDRSALQLLGAEPNWLGFVDTQYGSAPTVEEVAAAIAERARGTTTVVGPLGIWHRDHVLVADACLLVFDDLRATHSLASEWWLYADVPYRQLDGGRWLRRRLETLAARRLELEPLDPDAVTPPGPDGPEEARVGHAAAKAAALRCYPTQMRALANDGRLGLGDAAEAEQLWRLVAR